MTPKRSTDTETRTFTLPVNRPVGLASRPSISSICTDETVEITVDWAALLRRLGERAVRNTNGRAQAQGGIIVARHRRG